MKLTLMYFLGVRPNVVNPVYCGSKHALIGYSRSLAVSWKNNLIDMTKNSESWYVQTLFSLLFWEGEGLHS